VSPLTVAHSPLKAERLVSLSARFFESPPLESSLFESCLSDLSLSESSDVHFYIPFSRIPSTRDATRDLEI
jgi:hypothetical protein